MCFLRVRVKIGKEFSNRHLILAIETFLGFPGVYHSASFEPIKILGLILRDTSKLLPHIAGTLEHFLMITGKDSVYLSISDAVSSKIFAKPVWGNWHPILGHESQAKTRVF